MAQWGAKKGLKKPSMEEIQYAKVHVHASLGMCTFMYYVPLFIDHIKSCGLEPMMLLSK